MHCLCVTGCRQKHAIHAESQRTNAHTPGSKKKERKTIKYYFCNSNTVLIGVRSKLVLTNSGKLTYIRILLLHFGRQESFCTFTTKEPHNVPTSCTVRAGKNCGCMGDSPAPLLLSVIAGDSQLSQSIWLN